MRTVILTETPAGWTYVVLVDGRPVAADCGYDDAAAAADDAISCPTPT